MLTGIFQKWDTEKSSFYPLVGSFIWEIPMKSMFFFFKKWGGSMWFLKSQIASWGALECFRRLTGFSWRLATSCGSRWTGQPWCSSDIWLLSEDFFWLKSNTQKTEMLSSSNDLYQHGNLGGRPPLHMHPYCWSEDLAKSSSFFWATPKRESER